MKPDLQFISFSWSPKLETWVDYLQLLAWLSLGIALLASVPRAYLFFRRPRAELRDVSLVAGAAIVARLLVPAVPFNWYSAVSNVNLAGEIYTKDTSYMPLVNQWITFRLGFHGILLFNSLLGVFSALLAWHLARTRQYGRRVALMFGLAVGLTPAYLRISVSDSTHFIAVPLFLIAALALSNLTIPKRKWLDWILLSSSLLALGAVRVESTLAAPAIIPLVFKNKSGLREYFQDWRLLATSGISMLLALICSVGALPSAWHFGGHRFDWLMFTFQLLTRLFFVVSVNPIGWIPLFIPALAIYYLYQTARVKNWEETFATALPYWLFSFPHVYAGQALAAELPSHAYGLIINLFFLLAAAKGLDLFIERSAPRFERFSHLQRAWLVRGSYILVIALLAAPYRTTYSYMDEFQFLQRSLPREKAKVIAIWDPAVTGGDYDCCLALPYPTFIGDFPNLSWRILGKEDLNEETIKNLDFDYYYPGSLVQLDVENFNDWLIGRILGVDPEKNAQQQAPIRKLQRLDKMIRELHNIEIVHQSTVPAHTFSFAGFQDNQATLTLYRSLD